MDDLDLGSTWLKYYKTRDKTLKDELILHYLPLVKAIASRISYQLPSHININDLISAGICGLITCVEKFNPETGYQFKTFSTLRIHGAMLDELRNLDWVPRSIRAKAKKIQTAFNAVQQNKKELASDIDVAEFLGVTQDEFNSMCDEAKAVNLISIDSKIYSKESSSMTYSDVIKDSSKNLPHQDINKQEIKKILIETIEQLTKQEKMVLVLYYFQELTLREIGEVLEVTESRACQIHSKAIYRLRAKLSLTEAADYASA